MNSPYLLDQLVRIRQDELRRMGSVAPTERRPSDLKDRARRLAPRGRRTLGLVVTQAAWHR